MSPLGVGTQGKRGWTHMRVVSAHRMVVLWSASPLDLWGLGAMANGYCCCAQLAPPQNFLKAQTTPFLTAPVDEIRVYWRLVQCTPAP